MLSPSLCAAIGCPSCGAPVDPFASACASCGRPLALETETRQSLEAYRFRIRRDLHHLRALVTPKLAEAMLPRTYLIWSVGAFLGFVAAFILVPIAVVGLGLVLLREMNIVVVLLAVASDAVLLVVGPWWLLRWARGYAARVRTRARQSLREIDLTRPARCSRCGATVRVVATNQGGVIECPWCQAAQLPAPGFEELVGESVRAALARLHLESDRANAPSRAQRGPVIPAGFVAEPGGTVLRGVVGGLEIVAFNEIVGDRCIQRLELVTPTGLSGERWWIATAAAQTFRAFLVEWEEDLPSASGSVEGWCYFGAEPQPARLGAVGQVLRQRLGPDSGFVVDAGGLSLWRSVGLLAPAWQFAAHNAELLAWAATALQPRAGSTESATVAASGPTS